MIDPSGASTDFMNVNAFDAEGFVSKPVTGMWTIVVMPIDAQDSTFRLRAKLEKSIYGPPTSAKVLAPDLIVPRLWEFGFVAPVTGLAGVSFDDANPPVDAAGIHPFSCNRGRGAGGSAPVLALLVPARQRWPGNFDVRFDTSKNPQSGPMIQCVERPGKGAVRAQGRGVLVPQHARPLPLSGCGAPPALPRHRPPQGNAASRRQG